MALTGLKIQKLLPGTNCKDCGSNTCMAFAMKLAAKKAEISQCPHASEEAIQTLGAATEPPVKAVAFGTHKDIAVGDETVLYRHEKTFVNQALIAININDTDDDAYIEQTVKKIDEYEYERVGEILTVDMIAITQKGDDSKRFLSVVDKVINLTGKPLVVKSSSSDVLMQTAEKIRGNQGLVYPETPEVLESCKQKVVECGHGLVASASNMDDLFSLVTKLREEKITNIILNLNSSSLAEQLQLNTIARRAAIRDNIKPLGYSFIKYIDTGDILDDMVEATTEIDKYGGICVLPSFDEAFLASLFTLRLNIFTDPQKPIQVEPNLYPIGEPGPDSPLFVTTNFSLTYFVVSGEIENSGTSAWLLVPECEGMSVLTAWAAGKFNAHTIQKFINENSYEEKIKSRKIIIPGYVAQISGELEELLSEWEIMVGPQEAADIESFIKMKFAG